MPSAHPDILEPSAAPDVTAPGAARRRHRRYTFGFWSVALAFVVNMALIAVPTPLYVIYQQRDHFSTITLTIVYAVYAAGVILSLFLGGHLSDWFGRKRVYIPALLLNAASALIFVADPSLPGLFIARLVSGVAIGLATATATAYLSELHAGRPAGVTAPHRPQIVLAAANLGGIAIGPLAAGVLATFAPQPLRLPYLVFLVALVALTALVALSPETGTPLVPRPRYRPQRIAVPRAARRTFFAATATSLAAFAVYGIFNSLAPSFLAVTLHQDSHAVAGAVAFAVFAAGAVIQIAMSRAGLRTTLRRPADPHPRARPARRRHVVRDPAAVHRRRDRRRRGRGPGVPRRPVRRRRERPAPGPGGGAVRVLPRHLHRAVGSGGDPRDRHPVRLRALGDAGVRGHRRRRRRGQHPGSAVGALTRDSHPAR